MSRIKVLSQKTAFTAHHFLVKESHITFDNEERHYNHVEIKPCAYIIPMTSEGDIYLIKQYRYIFDQEFIEIVAGVMNEGEDPFATAKRELEEETGLKARTWRQLLNINTASSMLKAQMHYFLATDLEPGEQHLDADENIEVLKMPLSEAVEKVLSGEISNQKTISGILLVHTLRQRGEL